MLLSYSKIAVFCVFAVLSQVAFSQVERPVDTNFVDARGLRQGPWRVINTDRLSFEGQFKDGRPYGQFRYFDRFNRTATILEYFREGHAAKVTHFHPTSGRVRATGFFLERERDSTWEIFDTVGRIIERINYLNGMRHGLSELFDKNGELIESFEWYRDLRNGRWWQRTERGEQWTTYRNNLSHGVYEAFFANGNPFIKGYYQNGLKESTWFFYHENGLLDRVMQFKNNVLIRRQVAINVRGDDILIDTDSVAYVHTNGRIVEIRMLDKITYRPSQTFEQLVRSFDTEDFFLATPRFLAPFKLFDSLIMQDDEDEEPAQTFRSDNPDFAERIIEEEQLQRKRALLKLRVPTPYPVYVDGDVIGLLQSIMNPNPVIPQ